MAGKWIKLIILTIICSLVTCQDRKISENDDLSSLLRLRDTLSQESKKWKVDDLNFQDFSVNDLKTNDLSSLQAKAQKLMSENPELLQLLAGHLDKFQRRNSYTNTRYHNKPKNHKSNAQIAHQIRLKQEKNRRHKRKKI